MKNVLIMTPPEVYGTDLKHYRQKCLHLNVNTFAALFGTSRQNVARLERLERPLTSGEVLSIDLSRPAREGKAQLELKEVTETR